MIDLSGRVAIVTGAGGGLGRAHALLLARRGARVVVNDLGKPDAASGAAPAEQLVSEIRAAGGDAIASLASVADFAQVEAMVAEAVARWGRVDILVNNAGILRDKSFSKMTIEDFRIVMDVHLMGAVHCTKAVWELMREAGYGRIVMTTSSSGMYGNFGQANYSAAKMALVGLMQTLSLEGRKHNIRVNALAPTAATQMMQGVAPPEVLAELAPEAVSPGLLALVAEDAPDRTILCAGGGSFETANITLTRGIHVGLRDDAAEQLQARWGEVVDRSGEIVPQTGGQQGMWELEKAGFKPPKP